MEALEHLASIDLVELCNEAKVEHCRAIRDLRSCGRYVQYVLSSCGHASLCAECSQRCDMCPICRIPLSKNGNRLRLYYECIEAGLISKRYDDRFQEKEDSEKQLTADVQRLYSFFDVALGNNLVSLVCHYITDVCMDESAVSSDPVIAFLLDEVVVKDWCKKTFENIVADLREIFLTDALEVEEMKTRLPLLHKLSSQLTGITNVLEVLETSIKGSLSAQYDLHNLQEKILKAKQHLDIMAWCIRHQFLENVKSRYLNDKSWRSLYRERKSAAMKRCWPDLISKSAEPGQLDGSTLFIEDALSHLQIEHGYGKDNEITALVKDGGSSSFLRSKLEGAIGCYPFESLRAAADILFLCGSSDLVIAKQAIFLYYLFDRHWTTPDEKWRCLIDDFAASFGISRQSLLESLTFYLLDDHTDHALQEACRLLPEIAGSNTHPKITQVLLERQNPDAALMVLRWSGRDGLCAYTNSENGGVQLVSLCEAVTAVRVRVECGLLTEAFMYQRIHCLKVKENKLKRRSFGVFSNDVGVDQGTWVEQMESLVTEICYLCIRRNLVDRMIELPWSSDEEKYLHKCLFDHTSEDPSSSSGSLLVVFYLQRLRYIEAYQVDRKLQSLEQDIILMSSTTEEVQLRIRSTSQWRTGLVDKGIALLPEAQQQQVRSGSIPDIGLSPAKEVESLLHSSIPDSQPNINSILVPKSTDCSVILQMNPINLSKETLFSETPSKFSGSISKSPFEHSHRTPSIVHGRFLTPARGTFTPHDKDNSLSKQIGVMQNFKFNSPQRVLPLKELNRRSSKTVHNDHQPNKFTPGIQPDLFFNQSENTHSSYNHKQFANEASTPRRNYELVKDTVRDRNSAVSGKQISSEGLRPMISTDESMDFSWSNGNKEANVEAANTNGGPRWRSDDTSEDEEEPSPNGIFGGASAVTPLTARCISGYRPISEWWKMRTKLKEMFIPMNYSEIAFGKLQPLKMGFSSFDDYIYQFYLLETRARLHETKQQRYRPPAPTATPAAPDIPGVIVPRTFVLGNCYGCGKSGYQKRDCLTFVKKVGTVVDGMSESVIATVQRALQDEDEEETGMHTTFVVKKKPNSSQ
ncbi:hypothetical protein GIB67_008621 [Kingdonia uniflora]|uniref:CCHC-type domain-containing protein n=1 Tax=Kingdonia uniflora TaxID=39325 RepID=A0A7J7M512_9MAGN|nr:hypothetical protein GIB67_008621 [Kingdonia uniflora]